MKKRSRITSIGQIMSQFVFILMILSIMIPAIAQNASGERANIHMNLRKDFVWKPETNSDPDAEAQSILVEASYFTDFFGQRSNKGWVNIGNWPAPERDFTFELEGIEGQFINIWYRIEQEGHDAEPEFRFTIHHESESSESWFIVGGDGQDTGDDSIIELNEQYELEIRNTIVAPEDTFELIVNYSGYEDCTIFFDNRTYDSGCTIGTDFLNIFALNATEGEVRLELADAFGSDWNEVQDFIQLEMNDTIIQANSVSIQTGTTHTIQNESIISSIIVWKVDNATPGQKVDVWVKYIDTENDPVGIKKEVDVVKGNEGDNGDNGDDDDDDDDFIPGFEGVIVIGVIVGVAVVVACMEDRKKK